MRLIRDAMSILELTAMLMSITISQHMSSLNIMIFRGQITMKYVAFR